MKRSGFAFEDFVDQSSFEDLFQKVVTLEEKIVTIEQQVARKLLIPYNPACIICI